MTLTAFFSLPLSSAVTLTSSPVLTEAMPSRCAWTRVVELTVYDAVNPSALLTVIDVAETPVTVPRWVSTVC